MQDLYKTCEEYPEPVDAKVTGTLPEWLEGSLYRNGPGKFEFGEHKFNHWFDGMALVHRFHISKGRVTYRSRFLNSDAYVANKKANRIVCAEFGTAAMPDPCKTLFERFMSIFESPKLTDNCLVNVFPIGDALFTATETNILHRIDPETLESIDKLDLKKVVAVNTATAHPHTDTAGVVYNLGATYSGGYKYNIIKIPPAKKTDIGNYVENTEIVAQIPARWRMYPSYYHSFAITEHYFVFLELPLVLNLFKLMIFYIRGKAFSEAMEWHPKYHTKFHIIERATCQKVNPEIDYVTSPMMVFHHINAYEEDDQLVLDVCGFQEGNKVPEYTMEKLQGIGAEDFLKGLPKSQGWRFVLPLRLHNKNPGENLVTLNSSAAAILKSDKKVYCEKEILCDNLYFDLPQINYKAFNGKKYNYVYGTAYSKSVLNCLVKLDISSKQAKTWQTEGHYPSEPVFVSAPDAMSEDEGVILSVVLTTGPSRYAYLLVLDAKSFEELARAEIDVKLVRDIHGTFIKT